MNPSFTRREFSRPATVGSAWATTTERLQKALEQTRPYPVNSALFSDALLDRATLRLEQYRYYVGQYLGEGSEQLIVLREQNRAGWVNWNRRIVKKRARWGAAKGFTFEAEPIAQQLADWLLRVWNYNGMVDLLYRTCITMLVRGDAYWWFYPRTYDEVGRALPKEQHTVGVTLLDSACVFPVWREDEPTLPKAVLIQMPVQAIGDRPAYLKSLVLTETTQEVYENEQLVQTLANPYGVVPLVHLANERENTFGVSALTEVAPLCINYNAVLQQWQRIIRYCSDPTTIVYGASMKTVEKVGDRLWSNFPPPGECRVENLEMKGEMEPIQRLLAELKQSLLEAGCTPQIAYEATGLSMANASGAALQLLYQPLLEVTHNLQTVLAQGVLKGNQLIAAIFSNLAIPFSCQSLLPEDQAEVSNLLTVKWSSCLPQDENEALDRVLKKLSARLISRAEAQRQLGVARNQRLVAKEVLADAAADLLLAREKAVAVGGGQVNTLVAAVGSIEQQAQDALKSVLDYATHLKEVTPETTENADEPLT